MTNAEPLHQTARLAIDQSLLQAIAHHQAGNLQDAERLYRTILQVQPNHPEASCYLEALEMQAELVALFTGGRFAEATDLAQLMMKRFPVNGFAWVMSGMLLKQAGRNVDALSLIQKGVALWPNYAAGHSNLGNIFMELGLQDEAKASYRRALEIKPNLAEAHNNLGAIFLKQGRLDEAEASCRQALRIRPDNALAHNNLGYVFHKQGRLGEAEESCRRALQIKPDYADAYGTLGEVLRDQGRPDDALVCFQQQVRLTPENSVVQHQIASLTGNNTERAPVQYVERLFDDYADRFDTHLQQVLKYEAPEKLVTFIAKHSVPHAEKWNVLGLGCGTGLAGLAIAPFARHLVGVDLSVKMLEKAHARNLYQRLERLDLLTMMREEKTSSYDVIIAADVFIYLGKLDDVVSEIKRLLCPGGIFAFSVEALELPSNEEVSQSAQREYQLENSCRYTHSANYINRLASANGFFTHEMAATQIRMELGKSVNGYLVLWKS